MNILTPLENQMLIEQQNVLGEDKTLGKLVHCYGNVETHIDHLISPLSLADGHEDEKTK